MNEVKGKSGVYIRTNKTRKILSKAHKGKHSSPKTEFKKGYSPWNKGKKCSEISKRLKGGHLSFNTEFKVGHRFNVGEKNYQWKKDRSQIKGYWKERNNSEYKQWVKKVKKRDNNTCQLKNENCSGYLIVHHIRNWSECPELRYKTSNGITLCQVHHPRMKAEEKRLIPVFQKLVSVSNV